MGKISYDPDTLELMATRIQSISSEFSEESLDEVRDKTSDLGPASLNSAANAYVDEGEGMYDRMDKNLKDVREAILETLNSFEQVDNDLADSLKEGEGGGDGGSGA